MLDIKEYEDMMMLELPESEREQLGKRLNELAESFTALETVDADGVEPLVSVLDLRNVLREDVSEQLITRDELMSNSPEQYDGYFKVPGTI